MPRQLWGDVDPSPALGRQSEEVRTQLGGCSQAPPPQAGGGTQVPLPGYGFRLDRGVRPPGEEVGQGSALPLQQQSGSYLHVT